MGRGRDNVFRFIGGDSRGRKVVMNHFPNLNFVINGPMVMSSLHNNSCVSVNCSLNQCAFRLCVQMVLQWCVSVHETYLVALIHSVLFYVNCYPDGCHGCQCCFIQICSNVGFWFDNGSVCLFTGLFVCYLCPPQAMCSANGVLSWASQTPRFM